VLIGVAIVLGFDAAEAFTQLDVHVKPLHPVPSLSGKDRSLATKRHGVAPV
jgi:hypothetical protein